MHNLCQCWTILEMMATLQEGDTISCVTRNATWMRHTFLCNHRAADAYSCDYYDPAC